MVDLNNKNQKDTAAKAAADVVCPEPPQTISKGEKWFDWLAYKGVNYWVNLISSIAIADYYTHGSGRVQLDKAINNTANALTKTGLAPKTAYKQSKVAMETLTLTSGGWLLLIPLKIMEDNKRPLVHWLNNKLGVSQKAADGHELTADEIHLEHEQPKQTWGNVIKRRIMATLSIMGTGMALDYGAADKSKKITHTYNFNGQSFTEETYLGGKERATAVISDRINQGMNALTGTNKFGANPKSWGQRWMHLGILDSVFTAISAGIMYATNGAKKADASHTAATDANATAPALILEAESNERTSRFADTLKPAAAKLAQDNAALSHAHRILSEQPAEARQGI